MLKVTPSVTEQSPRTERIIHLPLFARRNHNYHIKGLLLCARSLCACHGTFSNSNCKTSGEAFMEEKKNCKNHTTKIYSRNVFPKLTLHSQNSEGPKAILGTFAFWFCRLALCFNFTLFCIFTGKECFIRCPQNFFYFCMISIIQTLPTSL